MAIPFYNQMLTHSYMHIKLVAAPAVIAAAAQVAQ